MRRHGWRVVAFWFLAAVYTWGLGVFGASVYLHEVTAARGWSVSLVSAGITVFYLTAALVLPAVGVAIDFSWRIDPGLFVVWAELKPGADAAKAEGVIEREVARLAKEGPTSAELSRAQNILRADFLREVASNNGRAHAIGKYEVLFGKWQAIFDTLDRYAKVTADDVKRVAAKYLAPDGKSIVTLIPKPSEAPAGAEVKQ